MRANGGNVIIDFPDQNSPPRGAPKLRRRTRNKNSTAYSPQILNIPDEYKVDNLTHMSLEDLINLQLQNPQLKHEIRLQHERGDELKKEIDLLQRYREKPLLFWRDELGIMIDRWFDDKPPLSWQEGDPVPLWSKQREIIAALVKHRKVAVKSGHGVGKSFVAAGAALYLALVWHATGMTTAPTFRQVRRILWGEIHYLYNKAVNPLGGRLNQISLDLGDKWFIEGFATDKPESNITGIHEENVFVVVDEAGGVKEEVFDALDALLTSENTFVLYIGNPIVSEGRFFDAFKPGSGFHTISMNCYDSPNVRYQRNIYPKLTSHKWVADKEKRWGKNSVLFKSRVEGEFPEENSDSLIPLKYLNRALLKGEEETDRRKIISYGADIARKGTDATVIGRRYASGIYEIADTINQAMTTEVAGRIKSIFNEDNPKFKDYLDSLSIPKTEKDKEKELESSFPQINVDDIGVGGGVTDILDEDNYPVVGINVGESPDESLEDSELFLNKRAQYYWALRVAFENNEVALADEETAFELSKIRAEYLRSGKIKIVDKELIKKELNGRSPDRAESMMLAWASKDGDFDKDWVRFV